MIVVDASALTHALVTSGAMGAVVRERLSRDRAWAGPDHLVVEVFNAIRGLALGRHISETEARSAVGSLRSIELDLIPVGSLLGRMWELRANMTGYDAAYVAVGEALDAAVVTTDARWSSVAGIDCSIEVLSAPD